MKRGEEGDKPKLKGEYEGHEGKTKKLDGTRSARLQREPLYT
jgi:hypothetical protein